VATATQLLADRARLQDMGGRGIGFTRAHQGATARVMRMLKAFESPAS
jgi:hypothetical protein